jgi:hypothetical protein
MVGIEYDAEMYAQNSGLISIISSSLMFHGSNSSDFSLTQTVRSEDGYLSVKIPSGWVYDSEDEYIYLAPPGGFFGFENSIEIYYDIASNYDVVFFYGYLRDEGSEILDFTFANGKTGSKVIDHDWLETTYFYYTGDGYIVFMWVDHYWDEAWYEENHGLVEAIAATLSVANGMEANDYEPTYINHEHGFMFDLPGNWIYADGPDVIAYGLDTDFVIVYGYEPTTAVLRANMNVGRQVYLGGLDDATIKDFEIAFAMTFDSSTIHSYEDYDLNGTPAKILMSDITSGNVSMTQVQVFYILNDLQYVISLGSPVADFDRYEPIFMEILESYHVIN